MSREGIDYQRLVEDALLEAVRQLLADVAEHGLPGDHSFLLVFRTGYPGVVMPRSLRDLYPDEMRIVLENQFWNLEVHPDHFSVELSFSSSRQRLTIPFAALTTFADPSAEFGLRFEPRPPTAAGAARPRASAETAAGKAGAAAPSLPEATAPEAPPRPAGAAGGRRGTSGEVIRFDPSRRK